MKKIAFCILFLLFTPKAFSTSTENKTSKRIKEQSQKLANALESESLESALVLFDDEATLLPEYHKSLWGKSKINQYYTQFFEKTTTTKFTREAFEVLSLDEYFVELGIFEHFYKTPNGDDFEYSGKYITYWKLENDKAPKIMSHIWGASSFFEAKNLNFVSVEVSNSRVMTPSTKWERDIEEIRKFAHDAVFAGDSKLQMKTYAEDAIYMTYYDPPFIGKDQIAAYFDAHYNPDFRMDSLMTKNVKVIDIGEYALKFGEYYVGWTWEGKPSYIEGKGLSLFKRMKDGTIKIYRQMINHSMPASFRE